MNENHDTKVINLEEHRAVKALIEEISDDDLEVAKKYIEALEQIQRNNETKPKG